MFWKILDGLFDTKFWKVIVIALSIFLFFSFLKLLNVANDSINVTLAAVTRSAPELRDYINSAYYNGILAILVFVFLAVVQVTKFIRDHYIAQQYRVLANIMKNFADGNIGVRHNETAAKEVKEFGLAFNQMADALQRLIEELQASEKRRNETVANVAHDLAGPLTAISGYVDTLGRTYKKEAGSPESNYIEIIKNNIKTVTLLISELTDLSRLDSIEDTLQFDQFSLSVLVRDVISRYELEAKNRSINLSIDETSSDAILCGDIRMIERVISNLVENAIYYTPLNGGVKLLCTETNSSVSLSVRDTGIGIPEKDLPFVFERFYRVNKDRSRKTGGSGLGLAIVKQIVALHGGNIEVSSSAKEGTTVLVHFCKTTLG